MSVTSQRQERRRLSRSEWSSTPRFQCVCGQMFRTRDSLDEHLDNQHPAMVKKCADCGRILPNGSWKEVPGENLLILIPA
jgi:hypothetical protein